MGVIRTNVSRSSGGGAIVKTSKSSTKSSGSSSGRSSGGGGGYDDSEERLREEERKAEIRRRIAELTQERNALSSHLERVRKERDTEVQKTGDWKKCYDGLMANEITSEVEILNINEGVCATGFAEQFLKYREYMNGKCREVDELVVEVNRYMEDIQQRLDELLDEIRRLRSEL